VRLIHAAVELGVTFFDTADAYGDGASEALLGSALRSRRDGVTLATKGGYSFRERSTLERRARLLAATAAGYLRRRRRDMSSGAPSEGVAAPTSGYGTQDFSPAALTSALDASLRRLRTDHVEIYQLHGPRDVVDDDVRGWAASMAAAGKIGCLGVGAENTDQARRWCHSDVIESLQLPFGVLDPELGEQVIPEAVSTGKRVIARGVLGAGLLVGSGTGSSKQARVDALRHLAERTGISLVALALGYVRARPRAGMIDTILVGASSPEHVRTAAAALRADPLEDTVLDELDAIAVQHTPSSAVDDGG
jgi:aryl-alcohol dehydrogenase-like predicted oxidoreductase